MNPTHITIGSIDPDYALTETKKILENFPMTERSNACGKFHRNYCTWQFHISSNLPIIKEINQIIFGDKSYQEIYNREPKPFMYRFSYVEDDSEPMCAWHQDRFYFNGQFHCSVQGNGRVEGDNGDEIVLAEVPNGTVWYLNGTEYRHRIKTGDGNERYEIVITNDEREYDANMKLQFLTGPERRIDIHNPLYEKYNEECIADIKDSLKRNNFSGSYVAEYTQNEVCDLT